MRRAPLAAALLAGLAGAGLALLPRGSPPPAPIAPEPQASSPSSVSASATLSAAARRLPSDDGSASAAPGPPLPPCDASTAEPQATTHAGDVYLCAPGKGWGQLTHHGKARIAALSPSRKFVLYTRDEGLQKISLGPGSSGVDIPDQRYVLLDLDRRTEREVARNDPDGSACMNLWGIDFVDDGYALVHADGYGVPNVHNHSMCGIDLARGKLYMVGRRSNCAVPLTAGRYRGMLWVVGFDFKVGQGITDWQGVVDRKGRKLRYFENDPFVADRDNDGSIDGNERAGLCADPPLDPATVESVQRKL